MQFCSFHPNRIALDKCAGCDTPICEECQTILKGKLFCARCAAEPLPGVSLVPERSPHIALWLSVFLPGLGQVYNGQLTKGLAVLFTSWLIVPWVWGIYDAYCSAHKINQRLVFASRSYEKFAVYFLAIFIGLIIFSRVMSFFPSAGDIQGLVTKDLEKLYSATEKYRQDQGHFPSSFSDLYFGKPQYIDDIYCDAERHGYFYTCQFSQQGYVFTARAQQPDHRGRVSVLTVTTDGQVNAQEERTDDGTAGDVSR